MEGLVFNKIKDISSIEKGSMCWKSTGEERNSCVVASVLSMEYEAAKNEDVGKGEVGGLNKVNTLWHDYFQECEARQGRKFSVVAEWL